MSSAIQVDRRDSVATLIIDRPPLNILDLAALDALRDTLGDLAADSGIQLLIVKGGGAKSFSAGVAVEDHTPDKIDAMLESFHAGLRLLLDFPAPTLAAIRGHCLGGGMELAAACDLRFATASSSFGQPEIQLGCYPPWAAAYYPELLGLGTTMDLLVTGRVFKTEEAMSLGFVHRMVEDGALDAAVDAFASQVAAHSIPVTRLAVAAIRARRGKSFDPALTESERLYTEELTATADMQEGLGAFLAKRRPVWQHR
jgi:cyclohexa-1,5-dienecarbonyl-CoA hydratase